MYMDGIIDDYIIINTVLFIPSVGEDKCRTEILAHFDEQEW